MFRHAEDLPDGATVECDLCVVGSGAAGLTVASWFDRVPRGSTRKEISNARTVVLEGDVGAPLDPSFRRPGSGRRGLGTIYRDPATATQHRYDGVAGGWLSTARPEYLRSSRLRAYGGTSVVWSGWWLPLEDTDLSVPFGEHSTAWPLSADELQPHYRAIHDELHLGPYAYDEPERLVAATPGMAACTTLPLDAGQLRSRAILVKRLDFGATARQHIGTSPTTDVYLNANVVGLRAEACAGERTIVEVDAVTTTATGRARRIRVQARDVVLACGALENTRLLLTSGLGNGGGHLGRHFREHPYVWVAARVDVPRRWRTSCPLYFASTPTRVSPGVGAVAAVVPTASAVADAGIGSFRAVLGGDRGVPGTISLCWEQSAGRSSRVMLTDQVPPDDLGLPRLRVDPDVTHTDRRTGQEALARLCAALAELGITPTELPPGDDPWTWQTPGRVTAGNHPTGITRMAADASEGVADRDCRVFGTTNLHLTGSGLFPRGGHANPTMTVVALAARLGEHLRRGRALK